MCSTTHTSREVLRQHRCAHPPGLPTENITVVTDSSQPIRPQKLEITSKDEGQHIHDMIDREIDCLQNLVPQS